MHASDPGTAVRLEDVQVWLEEPMYVQIGAINHSQGPMLLVGPHGEVRRHTLDAQVVKSTPAWQPQKDLVHTNLPEPLICVLWWPLVAQAWLQ
jgi:hypothetical protein